MDVYQQPGNDVLRVDRGSAIIEGAVALGIAFILFGVVVQVALLVAARSTAQAAVDGFARRAAVSATSTSDDFLEEIGRSLPGAHDVEVTLNRSGAIVRAILEFSWDPPGPRLVPVSVRVVGWAPVVAPP